ncbi:MAG: PDZ domain-containing protein [Dethiobacter sp.]|jgi:PDZ domain-containing protein|nr:PDZ domain-containing protein [Dethiobacter sp.]MBS3982439.1 PDZ domain-containing protein [Dethiobacter sp.]MCL4463192.1 PDZ domain-containing protein [Bacillota bacterium]MCL5994287.1 PDZ domain-containing protein [Bacillota bacterium]
MGRIGKLRKLLALIIIGSFLLFARTGYMLVRPGSAEDIADFISVEEGGKDHAGSFYLVTVTQQNASPLLLLYGLLDPLVDLQPLRTVIPPGMDPEEHRRLLSEWMQESQNLARVIALRRFGIDVPIKSDGVEVVAVGEESPALGLLEPRDIIVAVDGQPISLAEELVTKVQLRAVGEPVELTVLRGKEAVTVTMPTTTHPEQQDKAALRVTIQTLNWQPQLPVEIKIQVGQITGPSAGLMFVLEILNQLEPADLTAGKQIAGTGTINLKEEVGSIGGVRQKVRAAEKAGAQYFIVPEENFAEAKMAARSIELVPVATLEEALAFLEGIGKSNR